MTTPFKPLTPLTDEANMQMDVVPPDSDRAYDVATGYALLADAPLPPVLRGNDLEDSI